MCAYTHEAADIEILSSTRCNVNDEEGENESVDASLGSAGTFLEAAALADVAA